MPIRRTTCVAAPRQKPLAACLVAALAIGSTTALAENRQAPAAAHDTGSLPLLLRQAWAKGPADSWLQSFDPRRILPNGSGTIRLVDNCDDAGPGSLRDTMASAGDGDTVDLSTLTCSTITLTSGTISVDAADVTIRGPGQNKLRVVGDDANPVFAMTSKYGSGVAINDLTLTRGRGNIGGCVIALNNLVLERTTVTGCHAVGDGGSSAFGGGLFVLGNALLNASTISGNTASGDAGAYGGGLVAGGTAYAIYGSRIERNAAIASSGVARGGGIAASAVALVDGSRVTDSDVRSVSDTAFGGGVFAFGVEGFTDPIVAVLSATVSGNTAHSENMWSYGGGIQAGQSSGGTYYSGEIMLIGSTISGNTITSNCPDCWIQGGGASAFGQILAQYSTIRDNQVLSAGASDGRAVGGGLATLFATPAPENGAIVLMNSTVSGNQAVGGSGGFGVGGAIAAWKSPFAAVFSTVTNNSASTYAGGVLESGSSYTSILNNSIIAKNHAPSGVDLDTHASSPVGFNGSHNLVMAAGENIDLPAGTLSDDPKLLPLASNGGPTATHALAACSPAIDAGTLSAVAQPDGIGYDQRLTPYLRSYGAAPDIGAFELQPDLDRIFHDGFDPSPCP